MCEQPNWHSSGASVVAAVGTMSGLAAAVPATPLALLVAGTLLGVAPTLAVAGEDRLVGRCRLLRMLDRHPGQPLVLHPCEVELGSCAWHCPL